MEQESVARIHTHFTYPNEEMIVDIQIGISRPLTEKESYWLIDQAEKIRNKLRENTCTNDPDIKDDIQGQREAIEECFPDNMLIYVKSIPNEYDGSIFPWYLITTPKGPIKIGWRKRVIVIDWQESDIKESAEDLFSNEEFSPGYKPTMYDKLIHAWGYDKAKEYLDILLK